MSRFWRLGKVCCTMNISCAWFRSQGFLRGVCQSRTINMGSSRLRAVDVFICASVRRRTAARISGFDSRASATACSTVRPAGGDLGTALAEVPACPRHTLARATVHGNNSKVNFKFVLRISRLAARSTHLDRCSSTSSEEGSSTAGSIARHKSHNDGAAAVCFCARSAHAHCYRKAREFGAPRPQRSTASERNRAGTARPTHQATELPSQFRSV